MKKTKAAFIINLLIFVFGILAIAWIISGITADILAPAYFGSFNYFTVDSNLLMATTALVAAIYERKVLTGKREDIPAAVYIFKLVVTVGVTLTMLVTVFYLTPYTMDKYGLFGLFHYGNFFLHLLIPILSIITFTVLERTDKSNFRHTFTAIVPVLLYGVFYISVTMVHMKNEVVEEGYDWYGFFLQGTRIAFLIVIPAVLVLSYIISVALWRINKTKIK